jgi:effector-binding domain-containing protein
MPYEIEVETLAPQPAYVIRATVEATQLSAKLAELLPEIFQFILANGAGVAGMPFTRFLRTGDTQIEIEAGIPVVKAARIPGRIEAIELHGGPTAVIVHYGPHEALPAARAALKSWVRDKGKSAADPPWEEYLTDAADEPDPEKWETRVCQPIL